MILTYKIKHGRDFSAELAKARQVAQFALNNGACSSAAVKHIGLKSAIANQILRKYGNNKKIKRVSRVNLVVPGQSIKTDVANSVLTVSCLKLSLKYHFSGFSKVNQIEISQQYAFVSVTVQECSEIQPTAWLGVDLNTTGHCCVVSNASTGKVLKLGKKAQHTHLKYKNQRRKLQKKGKLRLVKKIKHRESCLARDLNHKITRKVIDYAIANNAGIVLEDLTGIRKSRKQAKSFRYSLHSWSFYQLQTFLEYKAKLLGIPIVKIDPRYTSQQCSRCGLLGDRNKKLFKCSACGHVEDADVNASFVIGLRHQGMLRLPPEEMTARGALIPLKRQPHQGCGP
jgi:putative transposase